MTRSELLVTLEATFREVRTLEETKGKEYTNSSGDRLENFKGEAAEVGVTPLQIWAVYASKHYRAIKSYVREGKTFSTESIDGRIDDLILYLLLLKGLISDLDRKEQPVYHPLTNTQTNEQRN